LHSISHQNILKFYNWY